MDHDRAKGETAKPQEFTMLKIRLQNPEKIDPRLNQPTYVLAATLRPETMIGQTNYWVKPRSEYCVVQSSDALSLYIASQHCVHNMFAQGIVSQNEGIFVIQSDLLYGAVGTHSEISHPIRALPMTDISMTIGSGIVTSVPSDSPADFYALEKVKKNFLKYNLQQEWVNIDPIPVLQTPDYGTMSAPRVLEQVMRMKNKTEEEKMSIAHDICYKQGFYKGIMIIGPFKGRKVQEAKEEMKEKMIREDSAFTYYEPSSIVTSRTGEECVVMSIDQWYLMYGLEEWKQKIIECLDNIEFFHASVKENFKNVLEWLSEWACSRQFGLGTKLPFDDKYVIDSLSDSTIYMSYYTIAHILQGNIDGSVEGKVPLSIVDDAFFNFVFREGPKPKDLSENVATELRKQFTFFYPVDCRVSGKDLIPNHLTMFLYNHAALFDSKYMPKGIRANGHLLLNGEKMSKGTGNFLTMFEAIEKYSSTALRIGMADAGDSASDANFDDSVAIAVIDRLAAFNKWLELSSFRSSNEYHYIDELFEARISRAITESEQAYQQMNFKAALKFIYFDLANNFQTYMNESGEEGMIKELVDQFIHVYLLCLSPIAPEFCDSIWRQREGSTIITQQYPSPLPYNPKIFWIERFLAKTKKTD